MSNEDNLDSNRVINSVASSSSLQDISLKRLKPNKKIFTPNLNVTRNRSKGSASSNLKVRKKRNESGRKGRKNVKNMNVKSGPRIIKSGGLFSEGMGAGQRGQFRNNYGNNAESASNLSKLSIESDNVIVKVDNKSVSCNIRTSFLDHRFVDEQECINFSQMHELDAPIKLPMGDGVLISKDKKKNEIDLIVNKEIIIDDMDASTPHIPLLGKKNDVIQNIDLVTLLRRDRPTIIMLQFPITLPGQSNDDDSPLKSQEHEYLHKNTITRKESRCRLRDLGEGRIGKLQIHRSGNVNLVLGNTVLDVSLGTSTAFYQEVVSVSADDHSRSASIISISQLIDKMVFCPKWENLLKDLA